MFDLPTNNKNQRRDYREFRKFLISNGFQMLQYSVYIRTCPNRSYANKIYRRMISQSPRQGNIKLIAITEKQYEDMIDINCRTKARNKILGMEELIVI